MQLAAVNWLVLLFFFTQRWRLNGCCCLATVGVKTPLTKKADAGCKRQAAACRVQLCLHGNQSWMFHRMKIKPLLPARFKKVSCLFKHWVWADVADEGQMWSAAAHVFFHLPRNCYRVVLQKKRHTFVCCFQDTSLISSPGICRSLSHVSH